MIDPLENPFRAESNGQVPNRTGCVGIVVSVILIGLGIALAVRISQLAASAVDASDETEARFKVAVFVSGLLILMGGVPLVLRWVRSRRN